MAPAKIPFDKRIKQITRKHDHMTKGSVKRMRADGLIVEQPRRLRMRFPARGLGIAIILVFVVKALLIGSIGLAEYDRHIVPLASGTIWDRAAAWVLQPDAVSVFLADGIAQLIR